MHFKPIGLLVGACVLLGACASTLTPEQAKWIAARNRQPTTFTVPADEAEAAWQRAHQWVAQHSYFAIASASETVIQTERSQEEFDAHVSITVTRIQQEDGEWRFTVKTRTLNPLSANRAERVAKAVAYYTVSGIPYPEG